MALSTIDNLQVLFEDNHLIAINKRPSDIVQGDKTGDTPLSEVVKLWLKKKYNKPGNVFVGVAHRIDRPVSGVVVFAKTSKALARLNELFKSKEVSKTYLAAVCAMPPHQEDTVSHYMIKDGAKNRSKVVSEKNKTAKKAELDYRLIGESDRYFFLEVKPKSGRHHQIRVQLSAMGCVIKGDLKYGAPRSNKDASIHLHAREISFIHPVSKEKLTVIAPVPDEPVWNVIAKLVD
ncbi:RluA family pseudouridine synthase [Cryomorpha ignava]|uniref:RluA family pseudouridine synthase n=1 Tax=Cryomorpha ignava TaxID=101383 RepID=A0A7K3WM20_9FLAO|nr:RluA family pseudouridine synthase [Cryomorpha ignava]NEN22514.1 RluA family pseudouridine synthase [Cryomorpha ignava]